MAVKNGATAVRTIKASEKAAIERKKQQSRHDADAEVPIRESRPIEQYPDLADVLPEMCVRYREIVDEAARLEAERKELSEMIMPLMQAVDARSIDGHDWVAVIARGSRSTISETKLLEAGVDIATIEKCRTKVEYDYVQVRKPTAVGAKGGE